MFGTHTFPYWADDLRNFIGPLMTDFAHPAAAPAAVDYRSIDSAWTQWGWTVVNHRPQRQAFSDLSAADASGFTLSGYGSADVTTPASYVPDSTHAVTIGSAHATVIADAGGRLHLSVPLTAGLLVLLPGRVRVTIG